MAKAKVVEEEEETINPVVEPSFEDEKPNVVMHRDGKPLWFDPDIDLDEDEPGTMKVALPSGTTIVGFSDLLIEHDDAIQKRAKSRKDTFESMSRAVLEVWLTDPGTRWNAIDRTSRLKMKPSFAVINKRPANDIYYLEMELLAAHYPGYLEMAQQALQPKETPEEVEAAVKASAGKSAEGEVPSA